MISYVLMNQGITKFNQLNIVRWLGLQGITRIPQCAFQKICIAMFFCVLVYLAIKIYNNFCYLSFPFEIDKTVEMW